MVQAKILLAIFTIYLNYKKSPIIFNYRMQAKSIVPVVKENTQETKHSTRTRLK
jgi:hypothetical protein